MPGTEALATEFQLASLRQISAGLKGQPLPALMVSHTLKPVTEVTQRIVSDLGLPYTGAGISHGLSALGRAWWWSEQQRRDAQHWTPPAVIGRTGGVARHRTGGARSSGAPRRADRSGLSGDGRSRRRSPPPAAIGGPVVLKIASADIQHKSDIGGVALNVAGDEAVAAAFRRVMSAAPAGARVDGVLVFADARERAGTCLSAAPAIRNGDRCWPSASGASSWRFCRTWRCACCRSRQPRFGGCWAN